MFLQDEFELWLELNPPRAKQQVRAYLFRSASGVPGPAPLSRAKRLLCRVCLFVLFFLDSLIQAIRGFSAGAELQHSNSPPRPSTEPSKEASSLGWEAGEPRRFSHEEGQRVIEALDTRFVEGRSTALKLREREILRLDFEERKLGFQETVCFWLLIVAGICAVSFVVLGGFLIANGKTSVGVVTEVVSLLPAAGTAIFWKLLRHSSARKRTFAEERERHLEAIQGLATDL